MFHDLFDLSWLAIGVATVASFVLGGMWFAFLFAKPYAASLGRIHDPKAPPGALYMVGPFLCGLVTTVASAILIRALNLQTIGDAVVFGLVVGAGYMAATTVNTAINPNIPRPLFYGLVSGAYFTLSGVVTSMILVSLG
jgi:hypothetical protein